MTKRVVRSNIKLLLLMAGAILVTPTTAISQQDHARAATDTVGDSYAVATVKLTSPDGESSALQATPDLLHVRDMTLGRLIRVAYGLQDGELVGGPVWINSSTFDIEAKSNEAISVDPKNVSDDRLKARAANPMLPFQNLLADRFQLKVHREAREIPAYALVVAKGGSKMRPSNDQSNLEQLGMHNASYGNLPGIRAMGKGQLFAIKTTMDDLTHSLTTIYADQIGRRVVNMTGLTGTYDFKLEWTPDQDQGANQPGGEPPPDSSGPSIFTALQEQLGLKLEPQKHSLPVLVIDHVEMPSAN